MSDTRISDNDTGHRIQEYVDLLLRDPRALRGQQLRGGGATAEFENLLAERCGFPYCVATSNATTALMALAVILRVQNRIVYFPKEHWQGSVSAFRLFGAKIRRYNSNPPNCFRNVKQLAVAAIVANSAKRIARPANILLIEDSCRIPGLTVPREEYSSADIQVLSFGPGKRLSLGEGGAALFRSQSLYKKFVRISQHPERSANEFSSSPSVAWRALNGRMHQIAALLGRDVLAKLRNCDLHDEVISKAANPSFPGK